MAITLAFDVYGTLIDTHGVMVALEKHVGSKASEFSLPGVRNSLNIHFAAG